MASIKVDDREFQQGMKELDTRIKLYERKVLMDVGNELMRLSQYEVPHDTGLLQNSGHIERQGSDTVVVGYNKVYASRLHEHPEYRFQKGRKGKYLEDPLKNNIHVFRQFYEQGLAEVLR